MFNISSPKNSLKPAWFVSSGLFEIIKSNHGCELYFQEIDKNNRPFHYRPFTLAKVNVSLLQMYNICRAFMQIL